MMESVQQIKDKNNDYASYLIVEQRKKALEIYKAIIKKLNPLQRPVRGAVIACGSSTLAEAGKEGNRNSKRCYHIER
jgi:hypothetical protein